MTDRTLLARLDDAEVGPAPVAELRRAGRAARRRRRRVVALVGGAAAVVVLVAAVTGIRTLGGSTPDRAADHGASVVAPEGTRLVGIGRAVVAVPDTWTLDTRDCPGEATGIYYFPRPVDGVCVDPGVVHASKVAFSAQQPTGDGRRLPQADPVDGYAVVDSGLMCLQSMPPQCNEIFGIPELDAYVTVLSSEVGAEQIVSRIRDSLAVLPAGRVTVPRLVGDTEQQASDALAGLGLQRQVATPLCTPGGDCAARVVDSEPEAGAVVAAGSTVAVTLGSPSASTSPSGEAVPRLDGTWTVHALVGNGGRSVLGASQRDLMTLTFDHGTLSGAAVCNDVFGTYLQDGGDLRLPSRDLGSTLVGCDEPPLVQRLAEVRHVSASSGHLYLHAADWMIIAELVPR